MSSELVQVNAAESALVQAPVGGLGVDFNNPLMRVKPATLVINQPTTQAEDAIKGKLRILETGDQYDELYVTLLDMPVEKRTWYAGKPGELNRTAENLMCFSNNVIRDANKRELQGPDPKAKVPGALKCNGCPKASWEKWRQTKLQEDIPPCESFFYVTLIDTNYKMPLRWYVRSGAKDPFESALQNVARKLFMMRAKGGNPNIFDIGFKIKTDKRTKNNKTTYVPVFSGFDEITPEQKADFGDIFAQYVAFKTAPAPEQTVEDAVVESQSSINGEVVEPSGPAPTGEITI